MEKIALIVTIEYTPESAASFLHALFEHKERCLKTEPGTLQFEVLTPADHHNQLVLFELYANAHALSAHNAGESLARFKAQAGSFITKLESQQCHALNP